MSAPAAMAVLECGLQRATLLELGEGLHCVREGSCAWAAVTHTLCVSQG